MTLTPSRLFEGNLMEVRVRPMLAGGMDLMNKNGGVTWETEKE